MANYVNGRDVSRDISYIEFWSDPLALVTVTFTPTTIAGSTISISLPENSKIIYARRILRVGRLENTSGTTNSLDGDTVDNTSQVIQITNGSGYVDAIKFVDEQLSVKGSGETSTILIYGSIDLSAQITAPTTSLTTRWLLAKAHTDSLLLHDLQLGIAIYFTAS
jgi:hypothetical protein